MLERGMEKLSHNKYFVMEGSTLAHTGKSTRLRTSAVSSGQPIGILTDFQYTGSKKEYSQP